MELNALLLPLCFSVPFSLTQMNEKDRLLSESTLPLPDLYDSSPGCTDLAVTAFLPTILLLALQF